MVDIIGVGYMIVGYELKLLCLEGVRLSTGAALEMLHTFWEFYMNSQALALCGAKFGLFHGAMGQRHG